ncbi:hypothetical protein M9H77_26325 [Catharanthus roseus]|uniref:Uncharacterized protein n=1 Tax=Catharanthus roseus TaxID=4058 RepID=A0ACC0AAP6_CATRO|nr:hypothetical protein M9H77_26325 [Catharanthus roseus]
MQVSPQTLLYHVILNVTLHTNIITKLIIKYLVLLERCSPQCIICSLEIHRRQRASSDDVDGFFDFEVDLLEEGRSTWRAWPNRYLRGHCIMLYGGTAALGRARRGLKLRGFFEIEHSYGVWLILTTRCQNLIPMTSLCYEIRTFSMEPDCCITCSFEFWCRSCADVLICLDFPPALEPLM